MAEDLRLQFLRGNTVQNDGYKGSDGELTVDVERGGLRVHDGITVGGIHIGGQLVEDIEVTVGNGGDFTNIPQALAWLDRLGAGHRDSGFNYVATIRLLAGFVLEGPVRVIGRNYGWVQIVGDDPETIVDQSTMIPDSMAGRPFGPEHSSVFSALYGGVTPLLRQTFNIDQSNGSGGPFSHGMLAEGQGSAAHMAPGHGFKNPKDDGFTCYFGGSIYAKDCFVENAGRHGVYLRDSSFGILPSIRVDGAGADGLRVLYNSNLVAYGADITNVPDGSGVLTNAGSIVDFRSGKVENVSNYGIYASSSASVAAGSATLTNIGGTGALATTGATIDGTRLEVNGCGNDGIQANYASTFSAQWSTVTGAGRNGYVSLRASTITAGGGSANGSGRHGVVASMSGIIHFGAGSATECVLGGIFADKGGHINFEGLNSDARTVVGEDNSNDIVVEKGGQIQISEALGGKNIPVNTLTSSGIIYSES